MLLLSSMGLYMCLSLRFWVLVCRNPYSLCFWVYRLIKLAFVPIFFRMNSRKPFTLIFLVFYNLFVHQKGLHMYLRVNRQFHSHLVNTSTCIHFYLKRNYIDVQSFCEMLGFNPFSMTAVMTVQVTYCYIVRCLPLSTFIYGQI